MAPLIIGRLERCELRLKRGRVCMATLIMTPKATSIQVKRAVIKNINTMALFPLFEFHVYFYKLFSLSPIRRIAAAKINSFSTSFYIYFYIAFRGHVQPANLKQNRLQERCSACLCWGAAFPLLL